MIDFFNTNRAKILTTGSAVFGFVTIMISAFVKVPLSPEKLKAVEAISIAFCAGLLYLEQILAHRDHKTNVTKIDATQAVVISNVADIKEAETKIENGNGGAK